MRDQVWTSAVAIAFIFAMACSTAAETVVLDPFAECQWIFLGRVDNPNPIRPSLDTRQGSRAAMTFDLSGVHPGLVTSAILELSPVQEDHVFLKIEAIPRASSPHDDGRGSALDPFIFSTVSPEPGPCNPLQAGTVECDVFALTNPDDGSGNYAFFGRAARIPADVTEAFSGLDPSDWGMQLSLVPQSGGVQFGHSGGLFVPPTLTLELLPDDDGDGDGAPDIIDNCPNAPNEEQLDQNEDGRGDECQCGDATGDGAVTGLDIGATALCANGVVACDSTLVDADGDGSTTALDIGGIVAAVNGLVPTTALQCQRASQSP